MTDTPTPPPSDLVKLAREWVDARQWAVMGERIEADDQAERWTDVHNAQAAFLAGVQRVEEVVAAARSMPRKTPAPGGASTKHDFKIEAATVWRLDKALTELDRTAATEPRG